MTKKSDMASRYAAAHARREQRKSGVTTGRQYLPLAEEAVTTSENGGAGPRLSLGGRAMSPTMVSRLPPINYSYLRGDLIRIAILTGILFAGMIILSFIIPH